MEVAKSNKTISDNSEEIFRLRNHNKTLITKIKKLKNNSKREHSGKDLYNIPDPPTNEEDATMALTIRATAP